MIDMHYDLLTKLYMCYKQNDFSYIEEWIKNYNSNNVKGIIANLCFMSEKEMKEEYDPKYYDSNVSVIEMFKIVMALLKKYIPEDTLVLTSIEGCDYLNSPEDLVELKKLGLNAILPVWNSESKYGSGDRSEKGLTDDGRNLIRKAIELNIGIDLSHANEATFYDIVNIIKEYRNNGIYPVVYASHSNVRKICDRDRNLTDDQIIALSKIDGVIGVMSSCNFVYQGSLSEKQRLKGTSKYDSYIKQIKNIYANHLKYIQQLTGNTDCLAVSTDHMGFCTFDPDYIDTPLYEYDSISSNLREDLEPYFEEEDINKILYGNALEIFRKIGNINFDKVKGI